MLIINGGCSVDQVYKLKLFTFFVFCCCSPFLIDHSAALRLHVIFRNRMKIQCERIQFVINDVETISMRRKKKNFLLFLFSILFFSSFVAILFSVVIVYAHTINNAN